MVGFVYRHIVRRGISALSGQRDHEQYFYKDYFAYQPDYAEKILLAAKIAHDTGRDFIFLEETFEVG